MEGKNLRATADELLALGFTHQQAFEQLKLEFPGKKPKKLARLLQERPSWAARQRYRGLHLLLMVCIVLNGVLKTAHSWDPEQLLQGFSYRTIPLVPIATLLIGYGLLRWQGSLFRWLGWVNIASGFGLLGHLQHAFTTRWEPWGAAFDLLSLAIGLIILYLDKRAFTRYTVEKDPMGGPDSYHFRSDTEGW